MIAALRTALAPIVMMLFAMAAAASAAAGERVTLPLDQEWRFHKGDATGAEAANFDDSEWAGARLPHTWNGADGEDGGGYHRGIGWYRVHFQLPAERERVWIEFDGAALAADAWVNGAHAGRHEGGYARFRFDVTKLARAGPNVLAVRVDNARSNRIAPLGGDFTIFGGLYRPARLVLASSLHIDLADFGGPGVSMDASEVTAASARLTFATRLANDDRSARRAQVRVRLWDADGRLVVEQTSPRVLTAPGATRIVVQRTRIERPRLWDGRAGPHLYRLTSEILDERGRVLDAVGLRTGVRSARIDPDRGFILNGRPLPLYGVNYFHSGRPGRGLAVHESEIDQDFAIMNELGVTGLRFVHFQHPQRAYDLADELGLAVWTEAPLNSAVDPSPAFAENLAQQMRELIRQNRHHPSVVVWGLGNEVYATDDAANASIASMQAVAKTEDPTRPTAYAHCCQDDLDRKALHADLTAYNRYFGWYEGEFARIASWADERRARAPQRPFCVSEYGAGASVLHQQNPPERPRTDGPWHPEQYQTAFHEAYWRALRTRPYLWCNFVWVAFDLASDGRSEGDRHGINDKGLVTYDRAVRKDAWYWYQANWSDRPMAHIVNRRLTTHREGRIDVRAYSNLQSLALFVNGAPVGEAEVVDHVAAWSNVALSAGLNRIEVRGEGVSDAVFWTLVR